MALPRRRIVRATGVSDGVRGDLTTTDPGITTKKALQPLRTRLVVYAVALAGLLVILTIRQRSKPVGVEDYSVYYLGGTMALHGAWSDLYPVPLLDSMVHPGWPAGSTMKPAYRQAAQGLGWTNPFRFVYPPPAALLMAPLALLDADRALLLWWGISAVACWLSAIVAGAIYTRITGHQGMLWAALILGVTWSPLTWAAVRVGNTSAVLGALVGIVVYGWCSRHETAAALALYVGAVLKFVTLPLLIIPLLLGRLRAFTTSVVVAVGLTLSVVAICGAACWLEYLRLAATLDHPNGWVINVSLYGVIDRIVPPTSQPFAVRVHALSMLVSLAGIVVGLVRCTRRRDDPVPLLAGASALLGWFLVFEPTTENHYFVYLYPLWGYYLAESRSGWTGTVVAACIIGGTMIPLGGSNRGLPIWLHFHQLGAAVVAMVFGMVRLYQYGSPDRLSGLPARSETQDLATDPPAASTRQRPSAAIERTWMAVCALRVDPFCFLACSSETRRPA